MSRRPTVLVLAALALASVPFSGSAWAASSDAASTPLAAPPRPVPVPVWVHPPEAVRTAASALHDACAAWPKRLPSESETSSPRLGSDEFRQADACSLALDPENFAWSYRLEGGVIGAAAAGISLVAFKVMNALMFILLGLGRRVFAARDKRHHGANGWMG